MNENAVVTVHKCQLSANGPPCERCDVRILASVATWYVGHTIQLRPEMGGGRWRIVELMSEKFAGFMHQALAKRIPCGEE